jgi:hypothetical protein
LLLPDFNDNLVTSALTRRGVYYVQTKGYPKRKEEKAAEDGKREKAGKAGKEKTKIPAIYLTISNHKTCLLKPSSVSKAQFTA